MKFYELVKSIIDESIEIRIDKSPSIQIPLNVDIEKVIKDFEVGGI